MFVVITKAWYFFFTNFFALKVFLYTLIKKILLWKKNFNQKKLKIKNDFRMFIGTI